MRIAHFPRALIAVLTLAASFYTVTSYKQTIEAKEKNLTALAFKDSLFYNKDEPIKHAGVLLTARQNQMLLREEIRNHSAVDCCPSVLEMVEPEGGMNIAGEYVQLYRAGALRQRFYDLSCHQDIRDKPCRFIDRKLHGHSKCVQKYSYSYALVKEESHHHKDEYRPKYFTSSSGWTLDYIRVRSGCSCEVIPDIKKKRDKLKHKRRHDNV